MEDGDNPDARTRHRKNCLNSTIAKLKNPAEHDATVLLLISIWDQDACVGDSATTTGVSPIFSKRGRFGESPTLRPLSEAFNAVVPSFGSNFESDVVDLCPLPAPFPSEDEFFAAPGSGF
jgi:hypothetical protein